MSDPDVEAGLKEVELNEVEMEAEKLPMTGGAGDSNGALKAKEAGCGGAGGGGGGAGEAGGPGSGGPGAGEGGSFGGLSKEELLRVAGSPGWVRLRWALLLLFWLGWIAMLAGAALIIVRAPRCRALPQLGWWARGPVYRLRVGAFQDSQGDGRGDLAGVAMRMGELAALKMKAVVIGPIHRTAPDMINETKLTEIDSIYGDMEQFDSLLQVARRKGIKVILDLTPNYLGKQEWFGINFNATDGDQDLLREKEAFHFWLQKGVDGLQLGGIEQVLNSTPSRFLEWQNLTRNYSADAKERILIGATGVTELQEIIRQQNISDADLLSSGYLHRVLKAPAPLSPQSVWDSVNAYINGIGKSWPCWAMGGSTHMASLDANLAGLVPVMLYTLPGTPFIYYGDEIGLQPTTPDQDPWMMWNSSENAGFTTKRSDMGKPSLNETVEGQKVDGSSRLSLFKKLGLLKVKERSLQYGEAYSVLVAGSVVAYVRSWDQSDRFLVLLNFGEEPTTASMAEVADMPAKATVELSSLGTRPNAEISLHDIKLASGEGLVLKFPFVA